MTGQVCINLYHKEVRNIFVWLNCRPVFFQLFKHHHIVVQIMIYKTFFKRCMSKLQLGYLIELNKKTYQRQPKIISIKLLKAKLRF